ncbi:unnamed protein product [Hydatigera taeniaeformis]|uniref:MARVEL domain-containing protein n=1 Tax=Hydatigena taeniaeformis TaxID=6205 RepID=A0A0R3WJA2_HYDTA|nr:unnamed protein product [Hydatigera taeniaeformis]
MDSSDIYGGPPLQMPLTPFEFIKQPRALLKITTVIISVIGLGCSTNGCTVDGTSIFNGDANACRFAVAVTLLGFLFSLISLVSDYMYDKTANVKRRRYILISDIGGSGLFALLNFVAFCYLANRWSNTENTWLEEKGFEQWQRRNARSVIFFSFVALVAWVSAPCSRAFARSPFAHTYAPLYTLALFPEQSHFSILKLTRLLGSLLLATLPLSTAQMVDKTSLFHQGRAGAMYSSSTHHTATIIHSSDNIRLLV